MTKRIKSITGLELELYRLRELEREQLAAIREAGEQLLEEVHPATILKEAVQRVLDDAELKKGILAALAANTAGKLGKKWVTRGREGILKEAAGTFVELTLRGLVARSLSLNKNGRSHE